MAAKRPPPELQSGALQMAPYAVDDSLWLVKVPRFLYDHLQSRGSASLGEVREQPMSDDEKKRAPPRPAGAPSSSTTKFTLTLSDEARPESMPRDYEFRFSAPPPAMYLTSRGPSATSLVDKPRHEGRVAVRGEVKSKEMSGAYRDLVKERGVKANQPVRTMGIVDDERALKRERLNHKQVRADEQAGKERKAQQRAAAHTQKRSRPELSRRELKDAIKKLFAQKSYWSRQDLVSELGHASMMTDVLDEIATKVTKKGAHYNDWTLKDSLRTGLPTAPADGSSSGAGPA